MMRRVYSEDVGHVPDLDEFDQGAHYLVALAPTRQVIAAFRIVGPEQRPFDLDRLVDLSAISPPGRSPGLIGRLCVQRDFRMAARSILLPMGMLKLAHLFCKKHGITDLFLYAYPNLINFYRGAGFRLLDFTVDHPFWARVHVMHLDLIAFWDRHTHAPQGLARFLLADGSANFRV